MDSTVSLAFLATAALGTVIPAVLCLWYGRKHGLNLKIAVIAAIAFVLVQVLHTPLTLLTQNQLYSLFQAAFGTTGAVLCLALYLGILAALFEEIGRYYVFKSFIKERGAETAILFGIGWGGAEAIILLTLLGTANAFALDQFLQTTDLATYADTLVAKGMDAQQAAATVAQLAAQRDALYGADAIMLPFISLYERLVAMAFHVCASILVMVSILKGDKRGLAAAIIAHTGLDFAAVAAVGLGGGVLAAEAAVTLVTVATAGLAVRMAGKLMA